METILSEDSANLSRTLARLAKLGVIECERVGNQRHYWASRACPLFAEFHGLATKTLGLVDVLRDCLAGLEGRIAVAFVYGSAADGGVGAGSDIDLMVVGDVAFGEVVSALRPAQDRVGREVNPTVYPPGEFGEKLWARHPFLSGVTAGAKVFVTAGEDDFRRLAEGAADPRT